MRAGLRRIAELPLERVFVVLGGIGGALFLVLTPPLQAPDEARHLDRAFAVSEGVFGAEARPGEVAAIAVPRSVIEMEERLESGALRGHPERKQDLAALREELAVTLAPDDRVRIALPSLYSPLPYLPQALGVLVGRAAGAPPVAFVWLGRAFNLVLYGTCVLLALRLAPAHRLVFLLLALTPMALFQAVSLAADGAANGLSFLFAAAVLRAADPVRGPMRAREIAALAALGSVLALTKQAYAPLCAAVLVIPAGRFTSRGAWALGVGAIALAGALAAGLWFLALRDLTLAPLTRSSDPAAQLAWMAAHPLEAAMVLPRTLVLRAGVYVRTFVGVLGSLDVPLPGPIYLLSPTVLVAVAMFDGGAQSPVRGARRWILLGVVGVTVASVMLLAYVGWNQPSDTMIRHVQGRYFIPLAPFVAAALALPGRPPLSPGLRTAAIVWSAGLLVLAVLALAQRYWGSSAALS